MRTFRSSIFRLGNIYSIEGEGPCGQKEHNKIQFWKNDQIHQKNWSSSWKFFSLNLFSPSVTAIKSTYLTAEKICIKPHLLKLNIIFIMTSTKNHHECLLQGSLKNSKVKQMKLKLQVKFIILNYFKTLRIVQEN